MFGDTKGNCTNMALINLADIANFLNKKLPEFAEAIYGECTCFRTTYCEENAL